jgi:TonB-dependent starch-binding outer membrane protein SusC
MAPRTHYTSTEVESIDVLKDADATAICGSLGANEAILISKKLAELVRTRLRVKQHCLKVKRSGRIYLMNTLQYFEMS